MRAIRILMILWCCSNMPTHAVGQKVRIQEILNSSLSNPAIRAWQDYDFSLSKADYNLPLIEKIQIRTQTERLLTSRQEFLVRTNFNGFGQKKAELARFENWKKLKSFNTIKEENQSIFAVYTDIIQWLSDTEKISLTEKILELKKQKADMAETLLSNGMATNLDDYILMKEAIITEEIKLNALKDERANLNKKYGFTTSVDLDTSEVTDITEMYYFVRTMEADFEGQQDISELNQEKNYLAAVYLAEEAKNNKILDFVQLRYSVRDDLLLQNRFTVGLGLSIPWKGSSKLKLQELTMKQNEVEAEQTAKKTKLQYGFQAEFQWFNNKYRQYSQLLELKYNPEINRLKDQVIRSGRLDPFEILKIKQNEMELDFKLHDLKYQMMTSFINLLKYNGLLFKQPRRNYLLKTYPVYSYE